MMYTDTLINIQPTVLTIVLMLWCVHL